MGVIFSVMERTVGQHSALYLRLVVFFCVLKFVVPPPLSIALKEMRLPLLKTVWKVMGWRVCKVIFRVFYLYIYTSFINKMRTSLSVNNMVYLKSSVVVSYKWEVGALF